MISNPGSAQSNDLMSKSTYDTKGKNRDIFDYTDNAVSDKVTSTQVSQQISTATSSFATTSYVDTKVTEIQNRFQWQHVDIIPYTGTLQTITTDSTGVQSFTSGSNTYFYYLVSLPFPINLQLYNYEIRTLCVGKKCFITSNPSSTSLPAGDKDIHFLSSSNLLHDKNRISAVYPNGNLFTSEPSEYRYYETVGYTSKATTNYMRYNYISSGFEVNISASADQEIKIGEKQYSSMNYTNLDCNKVALYMGRTYSSTNQKLTWKAYQISFDYRAIT